jgi:fatty-acyl-CoA synthase
MDTGFPWRDRTIPEALSWAAMRFGDRTAVVAGDARISYRQLFRRVQHFTLGLHAMGIRRGDKVALWMVDTLDWVIARWAVPSLGAVLVPVNTRLRGSELRYILDQSDSATLIMQAGYAGHDYLAMLSEMLSAHDGAFRFGAPDCGLPKLRRVIVAGGEPHARGTVPFSVVESSGADVAGDGIRFLELTADIRSTEVAQLLYTSGTTSLPKGTMVCHGPLLENNFHSAERTGMSEQDAYLLTVPSFSASGVAAYCQCLTHGAKLVLMDRFSAEAFCRVVERERATTAFFADAIVYDLRHFPDRARYDLSSLRTGSGAPLSDSSFDFLVEELGVPQITRVYGMSETTNVVSRGCSSDSLEVRRRSNGLPQPGVTVSIVSPGTGEILPPETPGEIRIAGYTVMRGYYNKPEETDAAFDQLGRLCSGDLGMLNGHGELVYLGRVKEMLKVGGFNVAPADIESFLETCPGVARSAVVGVPDERLNEVPFAFIEAAGDPPDVQALLRRCHGNIAGYKVPRFIVFDSDWPMTGSQKVQKAKLRERAIGLIRSGAAVRLT